MDLINTGSVYVTIMSQIQHVRPHMAKQMARALVGEISAPNIFGIGSNPMTKKQKYMLTLIVERASCYLVLKFTKLAITKTSDNSKMGIVTRGSRLHRMRKILY